MPMQLNGLSKMSGMKIVARYKEIKIEVFLQVPYGRYGKNVFINFHKTRCK
jgi:hypothetical protein